MFHKSSILAASVLAGGLLVAQTKPAPQPKSTRGTKAVATKRAKKPSPIPAVQPAVGQAAGQAEGQGAVQAGNQATQPTAPVVPLRPEQMPAVAPHVTYNNGQLTVVAENSSMADVISAIRNSTGVAIETQGGPSGERIAARIGPAPLRDVLVSLLDGSHFDYIILGSEQDPSKVDRVILTQRSGGANNSANSATAAAQRPATAPQQQINPDNAGDNDEDNSEGFAEPVQPTPEPQQNQQPQTPQPAQPLAPGAAVQPTPQQPQDQQNVKTPEQLMEELRRMEQERRNQQQDPNAPRPQREDRPR